MNDNINEDDLIQMEEINENDLQVLRKEGY
jgi:hypothetical protein